MGAALTASAATATCSFVFFVFIGEISPLFFLIFNTVIEGEGNARAHVAGMCWLALACVGLRWLALARVGLRWLALACVGLRWLALARVGLRWLALACVGLRWLALARVGLRKTGIMYSSTGRWETIEVKGKLVSTVGRWETVKVEVESRDDTETDELSLDSHNRDTDVRSPSSSTG